ncbi:hypothetical protein CEXT_592641 [Caerostris extrusa]|uniref:Uncharacterized protein n=1 Tax=Caerostris extrusa TaxID=172846 RepID=A0AAV4YAQ4_CAEEX|nr:hypothetical protein CEXT_592641 [Caerostris extrusa]
MEIPPQVIPLASTLSLQTLVKPTTLASLSEHGQGGRGPGFRMQLFLTEMWFCLKQGNKFSLLLVFLSEHACNFNYSRHRGTSMSSCSDVSELTFHPENETSQRCLFLTENVFFSLTFVMPENCGNSTSGNPFGFHFVAADISQTNDSNKSFGTRGKGGWR